MKKLLILGGKPIGSIEMTREAQRQGYYVVVADYLPKNESPAKQIADEYWDVSTADIDALETLCREQHIDGVLTAVHEFNINRMLDLCERLNLPCYCKRNTWLYCDDKSEFKALCERNGVPVAKKYNVNDLSDVALEQVSFPVITKPIDGSGSRGFSICHNRVDLRKGYAHALEYSPSKRVLVEDYIPYDAVIIHYTMSKGRCLFSGISDKFSCRFPSTGASVMGLQLFPSKGIKQYLLSLDEKVRNMFEKANFTDGPIWIEAFYNGTDKFVFNEMGYRFGGSMTNYPVEYFYGIDQMAQLIDVAMGIPSKLHLVENVSAKNYCILPIHIHSGRITTISNLAEVRKRSDVNALVEVHAIGDQIQEWGSAQQVYCYLHVLYDDLHSLRLSLNEILSILQVKDEIGQQMLYTLFDIETINETY